ncbi:RNA-binding S4 domain-containing protein [Mangrovibacterium marinum]|uniref:Ribosome-associated heat shock protein Hsp15 n=1 Tax=Mangrovibacterium marinum TaxID=1639118 RepID=A0A2T5C5D4_9BACT|nr:RNA-binding S4 domain-containing protein [Mangrovibacterium marinum]PTN10093.1 ribosome-associated heat shock protein Hsp15 [Mangrovibacterium marinum]
MEQQVRIDKWLWAVRLFKTRSQATEACKKGRIIVDKIQVKPSRMIKTGDIVQIKKSPVTYSFKVLGLIEKRVGAKLVAEYMKDVTPPEELEILEMQKHMLTLQRDRGTGRPTKKERRDLDDFFETDDHNNWDDWEA